MPGKRPRLRSFEVPGRLNPEEHGIGELPLGEIRVGDRDFGVGLTRNLDDQYGEQLRNELDSVKKKNQDLLHKLRRKQEALFKLEGGMNELHKMNSLKDTENVKIRHNSKILEESLKAKNDEVFVSNCTYTSAITLKKIGSSIEEMK